MKEKNQNIKPQQSESRTSDINKGENKIGRAAHQEDTYDISHMDRQEGTMHHGALGGNFDCTEDNELDAGRKADK
jgi:hypothetical protein